MIRIVRHAAVVLAATLALAACGGGDPLNTQPTAGGGTTPQPDATKVIIGGFDFPGSTLLASIYSQALQAKGVQVEEKLSVGARDVVYPQLQSGGLTVVPEYNGALLAYLDPENKAGTTDDVNTALKSKLPSGLELLTSSSAEDKDTLTVTKATATKLGLATIEDLAKVSKTLAVGGPAEFKKRREAQFQEVYGLTFKRWEPTAAATADALQSGKVQVGNVFSTDPRILTDGLVSLQDPKNVFSAQNVTPLVNKAGVNDTVRTTLDAISQKLTTEGLVEMMKRISIDKDDPPAVAKAWLQANGLG
ncbi:ABC transporter substrate-binding protein [Rhizohabitans arisaemae]|uniref:ABC transporter substrate-binding protein n=1 Tax=Rhizohabitans arisaemae TaxID=2720610 RepID=UPI0024B119D8|nr:ABC transporter substrate-binding protein [Rhizohabitans arisaemae]